jgi:hypothetical protein
MGIPQRLGTIPLAIFTDASNNVGIGGSPSGSYKFEVTGTGRFTSGITGANLLLSDTVAITLSATDSRVLGGSSTGRLLLANSGTSTYGIFYGASHATAPNAISLVTDNTERLRITNTGNVGIGTSTPASLLEVKGATPFIRLTDTSASSETGFIMDNTGGFIRGGLTINHSTGEFKHYCGVSGNSYFQTFLTNGSERMRITSGGNVLINTTTSNNTPLEIECGSGGDGIYLKRSGAYSQMFIGGNTTGTAITFIRTAGSGGVRLDSGATAWASSSDERLKNINGSIENALDSLLTLRAVNFSWKSDETNKNNLGLIAQDIEKVFPETVTLDEENDVLGVRYTELIPVLVAAIQELSAKVSALENKS